MLSIVALAAVLVAIVAFAHSRRLARKVAILEEQYWQLKFEHGELKARLDPQVPPPQSTTTFVALTGLRSASAEGVGEARQPDPAGSPKQ